MVYKQIAIFVFSILLCSSCNSLTGTYVDLLHEKDTIIILGEGKFQRRTTFNDSAFVYSSEYKLEEGEIIFMDWKDSPSDKGFTGMEIDRPLFRSGGIKLVYNPDLEKGYYRKIGDKK